MRGILKTFSFLMGFIIGEKTCGSENTWTCQNGTTWLETHTEDKEHRIACKYFYFLVVFGNHRFPPGGSQVVLGSLFCRRARSCVVVLSFVSLLAYSGTWCAELEVCLRLSDLGSSNRRRTIHRIQLKSSHCRACARVLRTEHC